MTFKKALAWFLTFVMVLSLFPTVSFKASAEPASDNNIIHVYIIDETPIGAENIYFHCWGSINTVWEIGVTPADIGVLEESDYAYTGADTFKPYYRLDLDKTQITGFLLLNKNGNNGWPWSVNNQKTGDINYIADAGDNDWVVYKLYYDETQNWQLTAAKQDDIWPADSATVTNPTCTDAGYTTYTGLYTQVIQTVEGDPAAGHLWGEVSYEWVGVTSCTATAACTRDDEHVFEANATITSEVTTEPSYTAPGVRTYTATFAAQAGDPVLETQTKTEPIPALVHEYVDVYVVDTNKNDNLNFYAWYSADDSQKNADWPGVALAKSGTTKDGYTYFVYRIDKSAVNYDRLILSNGSGQTADLSFLEHAVNVDGNGNKYVVYTLETIAWDTTPDHSDTEIYVTTSETASTCNVAGVRYFAGVINPEDTGSEDLPLAAHTWSELPAESVTPNCGHGGYDLFVCTVCGEEKRENETGPVGDHVPADAWSTSGGKHYHLCTVCGAHLDEADCAPDAQNPQYESTAAFHYQVCGTCGNRILSSKEPHIFATEKQVVAATCTAQGYTVWECACGRTNTVYTAALGHDIEESWLNNVAPTCTEGATKVFDCTRCDYYETEEVGANGHDWGEWSWVDGVAPTCTAGAVRAHTCSVCQATETENVDPIPHTESWVITNPGEPGVENSGVEKKICSVCGADLDETRFFTPALSNSTIIFKNWDGTVLYYESLAAGETPAYPTLSEYTDLLVKPNDAGGVYTFSGWTDEDELFYDGALPELEYEGVELVYTATYTVTAPVIAVLNDSVYFATLADAIAAANRNPGADTIKMLASEAAANPYQEITGDLTLDLNGKFVRTGMDVYDATLTLKDTGSGYGRITGRWGVWLNTTDSKLVFESGTIQVGNGADNSAYGIVAQHGSVELGASAKIWNTDGNQSQVYGILLSNDATAIVNGGQIHINSDGDGSYGIAIFDQAKLTVNDGEINSQNGFGISTNGNAGQAAMVVINGGLISGRDAAIYLPSGKLTVNDGALQGLYGTGIFMRGGELDIPANSTAMIAGMGEKATPSFAPSGDGANGTGEAITIVNSNYPAWSGLTVDEIRAKINIAGGIFLSVNADPIGSYIKETNNAGLEAIKGFVTGGTFMYKPVAEELCADGYIPCDNGDYTYGVKAGAYVARINDEQGYETLEAAFAAAQDGDIIKLLADIENEAVVVNKALTLDMDGHEFKSNNIELIKVAANGDLTITGNGKITGPANGQNFDGKSLIVVDGGVLTILNGTLTATGAGSDGMYGVYVLIGGTANFGDAQTGNGPTIASHFAAIGTNNTTAPATINVYGGTYTAAAAPTNNEWWFYFCAPVYAAANGTYNLAGGEFHGYYGISSRYADTAQNITLGNVTINAASGTQVFVDAKTGSTHTPDRHIISTSNELTVPADYKWVAKGTNPETYELAPKVYVAEIEGGAKYESLAAAIAAAEDGDTIKLLADIENEAVVVNKALTLDMDGHEFKSNNIELIRVVANGDLTITGNGTITGPANGQNFDGNSLIVVDAGKLTIENGTLTATGSGSDGMYGVYILADGEAIFGKDDGTGPSITSHFAAIGENHMTAPANVTVYGGTYTANAAPTNNEWWYYFCGALYAAGSGEINIYGGTFNGYYGISDRYADVEQTLNIQGGTFNASSNIAIFVDEVNGSNSTANRTIKASVNTLSVPADYKWVAKGTNPETYELAPKDYVAQVNNGAKYETLAEAIAAAQNGDVIKLLCDLELNAVAMFSEDKDLVLDLGGFVLSSSVEDPDADTRVLTVENGDVSIKNGTINGRVNAYDNGKLVIEADAIVNGTVVVWGDGEGPNAKAPQLYVNGQINATGYHAITTNGTDKSGAIITINNGAKVTSANNIGIYLPSGNLEIDGGEITGTTAVYAKSGNLCIMGGKLVATGAAAPYVHNGNGADATGDALVIESCNYPNGVPSAFIDDGVVFESAHGKQIASYRAEGVDDVAYVLSASDAYIIPENEMWVADGGESALYKLVEAVVVTFDAVNAADDSDVTTVKIQKGTAVAKPEPDPTKDGFNFVGWFAPEAEVAYDFDTPVNENLVLTASWTGVPPILYYNTWSVPNIFYFADEDPIPARSTQGTIPTIKREGESSYHPVEDWVVISWTVTESAATTYDGTAATIATVDENGLVTFTEPGTVKVWLVMTDPSGAVKASSKTVSYKTAPAYIIRNNEKVAYASLYSAFNAAQDGETVYLGADSNNNNIGKMTLNAEKEITVDLNGFTADLTANYRDDAFGALFNVNKGTLNIVNSGTTGGVTAHGNNARAFSIDGTANSAATDAVLNIGAGVNVSSAKDCCVTVFGKGTVTTAGNLSSPEDFAIAGNGSNGNGGYVINVTGGTVEGDEIAIYHPNTGELNISGGTIAGDTAVYVKSGTTTISGNASLVATGDAAEFTHNGSGANATGDALVVENTNYPGGAPAVTISGGSFTSANGKGIGSYADEGNNVTELASVHATSNQISVPDNEMWVENPHGGYDLVEAVVVTFDADNAEGDSDVTTVKIQKGTAVAKPETDPTKENFVFDAWFAPDATEAYDFTAAVNENLTLTAHWIEAVAEIDGVYYATLVDAVKAVQNGETITLLKSSSGAGIFLAAADQKEFTIDFDGFTYTVIGPAVGSTGTQNQAFHLEKNNTVTLKNGTVASTADAGVLMLVQNYCNLTLDGMTLNGENLPGTGAYVLSTNNSSTLIKDTTINAKAGDIAFDVCTGWGGYTSNAVEVTGNSVIHGDIEVSFYGAGTAPSLTLTSGTHTGAIIMAQRADEATIIKANTFEQEAPADYKWVSINDTQEQLVPKDYVAEIEGGAKYESLAEAIAAAEAGNTIKLLADIALTATQNIDKDLTIDLNGHNIAAADARALWIKAGDVTITGEGEISSTKTEGSAFVSSSSVIRVGDNADNSKKAKLTIDEDVTVSSAYCYGVTVFGLNDTDKNKTTADIELDVKGTVAVTGEQGAISGNGTNSLSATTMTISGSVSAANDYAIYHPGKGTLTVSGTVSGKGGIEAKAGTININAGAVITATATEQSHTGNNNGTSTSGYAIAAVGNPNYVGDPAVNINGGTINGIVIELAEYNSNTYGQIVAYSNEIAIPADYKWVAKGTVPESYDLVLKEYVAQIGDNKYESLAEAAAAAQDGDTIVMIADEEIKNGYVVIDKDVTLDLNGKTIAVKSATGYVLTMQIAAGATVQIVDNSEEKTGAIKHQYGYTNSMAIWNNGILTITGGTIEGMFHGIYNRGELFVKDCAINATYNSDFFQATNGTKYYTYGIRGDGEVTVEDGAVIHAKGYGINSSGDVDFIGGEISKPVWGIAMFDTAKLAVSGGKIEATGMGVTTNGNVGQNCTININGGEITSDDIGIYAPSGSLTITAGEITGATGVYFKSRNLSISGGTITGNGVAAAYDYNGNGANSTGDALVIDSCGYPNGLGTISVTGGNFISANAQAVACYTYQENVPVEEFVSGGEFSSILPDELVVPHFVCESTADEETHLYGIVPAWTVTYVVDDDIVATDKVEKGKAAPQPEEDPEKEGWSFDGWFAEGAEEAFDFATILEADITLTAKFTEIHEHSLVGVEPLWGWTCVNGKYSATATYKCSCGEYQKVVAAEVTVDKETKPGKDIYTATAQNPDDLTAEPDVVTREVESVYIITYNGNGYEFTYGQECLITSATERDWYIDGQLRAKNTKAFRFPVVASVTVTAEEPTVEGDGVVINVLEPTSDGGTMTYRVNWTLPEGAKNVSATIYRCRDDNAEVNSAEDLLASAKLRTYKTSIKYRIGEYTYTATNLTVGSSQTIMIRFTYTLNGETKTADSVLKHVAIN